MPINTLNLNATQIEETGDGQIGNANATSPFAKLTVSRYCLQLNIGIVGKVLFRPSDVISIEPTSIFKAGIRIKHRVNNYKEKVVFTFGGRAADLITRIEQSGFLNNTDPLLPAEVEAEIAQAQASGSFGLKTWFWVAVVLLWNLLLLPGVLGVFNSGKFNMFSMGIRAATGMLTVVTLALLFVPALQQRALKQGFVIKDIRASLYFFLLIGGFIFLITSIMPMP